MAQWLRFSAFMPWPRFNPPGGTKIPTSHTAWPKSKINKKFKRHTLKLSFIENRLVVAEQGRSEER